MNTVTQITHRRQAIVEYSLKNGATTAARRYNVSRPPVYRWRYRYDGTLQSLQDCSHKPPHSHPNQHTDEEIDLIKNMHMKNKHTDLVIFLVKLRQKGYTCSITELWRMIRKLELEPVKNRQILNISLNRMKRCATRAACADGC